MVYLTPQMHAYKQRGEFHMTFHAISLARVYL